MAGWTLNPAYAARAAEFASLEAVFALSYIENSLTANPVTQPLAAREPRRAATRARHLCRGRGGRGCRCHIAARPVVAHDAHPLRWHAGQEAAQPLALVVPRSPRRPQAPPCPV